MSAKFETDCANPHSSAPMLQKYRYDPSTTTRVCSDPLLEDPMEKLYVEVGNSNIPGAGQGLFAKVDLPANATVAFYTGLRLTLDEAYKVSLLYCSRPRPRIS